MITTQPATRARYLAHRDRTLEAEAAAQFRRLVSLGAQVFEGAFEYPDSSGEHDTIVVDGDTEERAERLRFSQPEDLGQEVRRDPLVPGVDDRVVELDGHAAPFFPRISSRLEGSGRSGVEPELAIGEVSQRSGLAVSAIRFYEDKGLIVAIRTAGGQRRTIAVEEAI